MQYYSVVHIVPPTITTFSYTMMSSCILKFDERYYVPILLAVLTNAEFTASFSIHHIVANAQNKNIVLCYTGNNFRQSLVWGNGDPATIIIAIKTIKF